MVEEWADVETRIRAHSPFLARLMDRFPAVTEVLASGDLDAAMTAARAVAEGDDNVARALRRRRTLRAHGASTA